MCDVKRVLLETKEKPWICGGDSYMVVKPTLATVGNVYALMPWAEYERLRARIAKLEAANDPELDGTDFAHPAWWRGHDRTTEMFCRAVTKILDGEDDGRGFNYEPWHTLRRRLLGLLEGGCDE